MRFSATRTTILVSESLIAFFARQAEVMGAKQTLPSGVFEQLSPGSRVCIERLLQYEAPAATE